MAVADKVAVARAATEERHLADDDAGRHRAEDGAFVVDGVELAREQDADLRRRLAGLREDVAVLEGEVRQKAEDRIDFLVREAAERDGDLLHLRQRVLEGVVAHGGLRSERGQDVRVLRHRVAAPASRAAQGWRQALPSRAHRASPPPPRHPSPLRCGHPLASPAADGVRRPDKFLAASIVPRAKRCPRPRAVLLVRHWRRAAVWTRSRSVRALADAAREDGAVAQILTIEVNAFSLSVFEARVHLNTSPSRNRDRSLRPSLIGAANHRSSPDADGATGHHSPAAAARRDCGGDGTRPHPLRGHRERSIDASQADIHAGLWRRAGAEARRRRRRGRPSRRCGGAESGG